MLKLFKHLKLKEEEPKTTNGQPKKIILTADEVKERAVKLGTMINETLDHYENLINEGHTLSLSEYKEITSKFVKLARDFEKIYELMSFDLEKIEQIELYNKQARAKRLELKAQLNNPETTEKNPIKQVKK